MTSDRIAGGALVIFSLLVIWQSSALPLGTFRHPGPAYIPILLALLLLVFGAFLATTGGGAEKLSSIQWDEWPHAVAILAACVAAVIGIERLGYRLTFVLVLSFLFKVVERRSWFLTASLAFFPVVWLILLVLYAAAGSLAAGAFRFLKRRFKRFNPFKSFKLFRPR